MKVFWSWQSDTPAKNNHYFVRDALELALGRVTEDLDLDEASRPEIDHDTKNEPGLVSIVDTIFKKIEQAQIFVGDLTFVGQTPNGKLLPNPNVMIELGHALTSLGHERIILVANKAYGAKPEDLPFDLRHRRAPITYSLAENATTSDRNKAKEVLAKALADALALSLGRVIKEAAKSAIFPTVVQPRQGDRSVWLEAGEKIEHHNFFHESGIENWEVLEAPRFYMRIIPANYTRNYSPRQIHDLRGQDVGLPRLDPWKSGDGGVNVLGTIAVGILEGRTVSSVTQWFKETSEIWAFNCHASFQEKPATARLLTWGTIPLSWARHLNASIAFLKQIGIKGPLQIEAGATGLSSVKWGGDMGRQYVCFEDEIHLTRVESEWDASTCAVFLTDTFNLLRSAYNQVPLTVEQFPSNR